MQKKKQTAVNYSFPAALCSEQMFPCVSRYVASRFAICFFGRVAHRCLCVSRGSSTKSRRFKIPPRAPAGREISQNVEDSKGGQPPGEETLDARFQRARLPSPSTPAQHSKRITRAGPRGPLGPRILNRRFSLPPHPHPGPDESHGSPSRIQRESTDKESTMHTVHNAP